MGLRDRVLAAQAEIEIRAGNAAAAAKAAGRAPAETEQERESQVPTRIDSASPGSLVYRDGYRFANARVHSR